MTHASVKSVIVISVFGNFILNSILDFYSPDNNFDYLVKDCIIFMNIFVNSFIWYFLIYDYIVLHIALSLAVDESQVN